MWESQHTLKSPCRYSGITLHTGVRAHITLRAAPEDSGITLIRADLPGKPRVQALATNVVDVQRATTLACNGASVHTVEHVLAALYACGVDNAVIEMDGPEPPIADGSSEPYVALLLNAGTLKQKSKRKILKITEPRYIDQNGSKLIMLPCDDYRISCTVKYGDGIMDTQYLSLKIDRESFVKEICQARTFCLYHDIEELMLRGLIRGGSLDNAVVSHNGVIICKESLRFPDEFVRHKILDIIGDLSLVGCRIAGEIVAIRPGHPSNVAMAQELIR